MAGKKVIAANGNIDLPSSSDREVTTLAVQLDNDATLAGAAVAVQGRVLGAPDTAYKPIPYKRRALLGVASDDTVVSAALGTSFIIQIDCAGMDIRLVVSGYVSGSGTLYWQEIVG